MIEETQDKQAATRLCRYMAQTTQTPTSCDDSSGVVDWAINHMEAMNSALLASQAREAELRKERDEARRAIAIARPLFDRLKIIQKDAELSLAANVKGIDNLDETLRSLTHSLDVLRTRTEVAETACSEAVSRAEQAETKLADIQTERDNTLLDALGSVQAGRARVAELDAQFQAWELELQGKVKTTAAGMALHAQAMDKETQ
jgi:chromosome segregation ATPase